MAQLIVRNLDDDVKERLKVRARRHGRSLEAEVRDVLTEAVRADEPGEESKSEGLGARMRRRLGNSGLTRDEWEEFDRELARIRTEWGGGTLSRGK